MIKNEWKSLWNNKILIIVVMAIIVIPVIYAGLFLKSMWDPYGNLDKLPVAVVNNDKSVEYNGKTLSVGSELVDELKDNDSLDFHFVDSDEAEQGLKNGTYYMVITIPEDFSSDASTLMDDNPKKMELKYETNPGTNYIASKMSETALSKIREAVASKVTETYTQTVFDQIGTVGDGMQEAADGSTEIKDGLTTASDGNKTITTNLKKLADRYQAMGDINLFVRILPYLAILTGIAGIVLVVIYLRGDRDTWDIFNLTFFIPAVLSGIELFLLTHSKTIRAIHEIMKETTRSMQDNGYKGFAGYRLGFYLFLAGIIISLVSAVCFFALDRE